MPSRRRALGDECARLASLAERGGLCRPARRRAGGRARLCARLCRGEAAGRRRRLRRPDRAPRSRCSSSPGIGEWVRYKLDQVTEHVLIDEAQDTNLDQWTIVGALVGRVLRRARHPCAARRARCSPSATRSRRSSASRGPTRSTSPGRSGISAAARGGAWATTTAPEHERGLPFARLSLTHSRSARPRRCWSSSTRRWRRSASRGWASIGDVERACQRGAGAGQRHAVAAGDRGRVEDEERGGLDRRCGARSWRAASRAR